MHRAWDAPTSPQPRTQIRLAGKDFARSGAILIRLVLQGIAMWLTQKGVNKIGELVTELRKSKLGPRFAAWVEENAAALMRDPRLKPHRGQGSAGKEVVSEAQSPSQLKTRPSAEVAPKPKSIKDASNAEKGVFGEAKADDYMISQGYEKMNGPPVKIGDAPKGKGIDGVWRNTRYPPPPEYVVAEAKYGSSHLSTLKNGTKQMSDKWVDARLTKAVGKSAADDIQLSGYEKWLLRVDETGTPTQTVLK